MEPNGVGTQTQNLSVVPGAQVTQQAQPQSGQQPNQIGGTAFQVVNPGQQQVQQPQQQPVQQESTLQDLRQQIATLSGYSIDEVPSDVATLSRIVLGGMGAQVQLQKLRTQQATQQPQVVNGQQQNQLQPVTMPPGWESMVTKNAQGVYEPTHPAFSQVAQLANQNYAVQQMRQNAVQAGNLLPEHEQKIEQMVQQRLNAAREAERQQEFIESHEQELFQFGTDGQRQQVWDPAANNGNGGMAPVMSEFGKAFNAAAYELKAAGAQFASDYALAKVAYKLAKERHKPQQQAQQNGAPPSQIVNNDLAALFTQHNTNNTQRVANVNGSHHQTGNPQQDMRAALRNALAGLPSSAPGTEFAKALGWNMG